MAINTLCSIRVKIASFPPGANAISAGGHSIRLVRFPNKPIPASMMPYLGLDDTRPDALRRLISQAHVDADMTKSAADDPNDANGQLIKALMASTPPMPKDGVYPAAFNSQP